MKSSVQTICTAEAIQKVEHSSSNDIELFVTCTAPAVVVYDMVDEIASKSS